MRSLQTTSGVTRTGDRGIVAYAVTVLGVLVTWWGRSRQRRQLRRLDDRQLQDVGLRRDDVERELAKPFWRS